MKLLEKASIIHYHKGRLDAYGRGDVRALGWKKEKSQTKRFEVITSFLNLNGASVLDAGCGCGDLKAYLDKRFDCFHYTGIDLQPEFIEEAKRRYRDNPHTYFFLTDFAQTDFPKVDFVVASGALSYRCADESFVFQMISKMYLAASRGVVFNVLDAASFPKHPILVAHDTARIETYCRALCPNVRIAKGYLEDDCTFFMNSGPRG